MNHAIFFASSKRNRRIIAKKYSGMPKDLPRDISLKYDPAQPLRHPVTLSNLRQLAVCGYIGLQRIPRNCIVRDEVHV